MVGQGEYEGERADWAGPLRWWGLLALLAGVLAAGALLGAGLVLARNGLGAAATARGCSGPLAAGFLLLVAGGALTILTRSIADMRVAHATWLDLPRLVITCPAPAAVAVLAGPSAIGCRTGLGLGHMPLVGRALVGDPAVAVTAAAAALLGAGMASVVRVRAVAVAHAE